MTNLSFKINNLTKKQRLFSSGIFALLVVAVASAGIFFAVFAHHKNSEATLAGFDPSNIISDYVMRNKDTMNAQQIQDWMSAKWPCNNRNYSQFQEWTNKGYKYIWQNGHFGCISDERFDRGTGLPTNGNGQTMAQIIYDASQKYSINPQVFLVMIKKESSVTNDDWPNENQYKSLLGYGCPDTGAGCDPAKSGVYNQINYAGSFFAAAPYRYKVGPRYVQYSPDSNCGGSTLDIKNDATGNLYEYTPYQPNAATLAAGTGEAPCGAYGNRNFYNYFTDWFGSTQVIPIGDKFKPRYDQIGGARALGQAIAEPTGDAKADWQSFQGGAIIGSGATGYWESKGSIRQYWGKSGYQGGKMGLPLEGENGYATPVGTMWAQRYQNGYIVGTGATGYYESKGAIRDYWAKTGYQNGRMGLPTEDEYHYGDVTSQRYQNGYILGSAATGYWESKGSIRVYWGSIGYQNGPAGWPVGPEIWDSAKSAWTQRYQNGTIYAYSNGRFSLERN